MPESILNPLEELPAIEKEKELELLLRLHLQLHNELLELLRTEREYVEQPHASDTVLQQMRKEALEKNQLLFSTAERIAEQRKRGG